MRQYADMPMSVLCQGTLFYAGAGGNVPVLQYENMQMGVLFEGTHFLFAARQRLISKNSISKHDVIF